MELQIVAIIMTAVGDILIGLSVLKVHEAFSKEKKIDSKVIRRIRQEHVYVFSGVGFIVVGLILQIISLILQVDR